MLRFRNIRFVIFIFLNTSRRENYNLLYLINISEIYKVKLSV